MPLVVVLLPPIRHPDAYRLCDIPSIVAIFRLCDIPNIVAIFLGSKLDEPHVHFDYLDEGFVTVNSNMQVGLILILFQGYLCFFGGT